MIILNDTRYMLNKENEEILKISLHVHFPQIFVENTKALHDKMFIFRQQTDFYMKQYNDEFLDLSVYEKSRCLRLPNQTKKNSKEKSLR